MAKASTSSTSLDYSQLDKSSDLTNVIDKINNITAFLNYFNKNLSFSADFNCYIAENVEIAAGASVTISHYLGVKPRHRIILNQVGNGVIEDTPSGWNNKCIVLKNRGSETVTITVMIVRE